MLSIEHRSSSRGPTSCTGRVLVFLLYFLAIQVACAGQPITRLGAKLCGNVPPGYSALLGYDHASDDLSSIPRSQVLLAQACYKNAECGYFNSLGLLKFTTSGTSANGNGDATVTVPVSNQCLYRKSDTYLYHNFREFKDFQYSCQSFNVLSWTNLTGPVNLTGFQLQGNPPSYNNCLNVECCKSYCETLQSDFQTSAYTDCWAYSFGYGIDSGCNNGGLCCRTMGYFVVNGVVEQPSGNLLTGFSRQCYRRLKINYEVLAFHRNVTSGVKYFSLVPPPTDFVTLLNSTTTNYPAVQANASFGCVQIPGYQLRPNNDVFGSNLASDAQPSLSDVELGAASEACNSNSACQAFNSQILLKSGSSISPAASLSTCLYIKQGVLKVLPNDTSTCLSSSSPSSCDRCAQRPTPSDRAACYRCLSSGFFSPPQCLGALNDGRLLNYSSGLVELQLPNSSISLTCFELNTASSISTGFSFSSDSFLYSSILAAISSNVSALKMNIRTTVDDAAARSLYLNPVILPTCSLVSGYFQPNVTGNWSFLGYGDDAFHLWVGSGATYGEHVLNSLLAIDRRMEWVASKPLPLTAGVMYPLLIRSCRCGGSSRQSLYFSGPGISSWTADGSGLYYHTPAESSILPPSPPVPPSPPSPLPPSPSPPPSPFPPPLPTLVVPLNMVTPPAGNSSPSTNLGLIIGATLGGLTLFLLLAAMAYFFILWKRSIPPDQDDLKNKEINLETPGTDSNPTSSTFHPYQNPSTSSMSPGVFSDIMVSIAPQRLLELKSSIGPEEPTIGERIGAGSFGTVYKGQWRGADVAVKRCQANHINESVTKDFLSEITIMSSLCHPNVVQLLGYIIDPPNNLIFISEFFPCGSLYDLIHGRSAFHKNCRDLVTPVMRLRMVLDICKGMSYLHSCTPAIVHRDLKPGNLLVDGSGKVKVCDFGMSRLLSSEYLPSTLGMGTVQYTSPEVMRGDNVSEKSDVYSFGVVLWEMVTMEQPWTGRRPEQVVFAVGSEEKRLALSDEMQPQVRGLIEDCWNPQPRERPSFLTIIQRLSPLEKVGINSITTSRPVEELEIEN